MSPKHTFFKFVIPSIIAFALSGVYAIVDGYFVGNTIGDAGLSAINIAYPIVAVLQALGTGIGASAEVSGEIAKIVPIFLVSLLFIAVSRIATASFYATEKSLWSYILTFSEPLLMLLFMLILPPLFGGQVMIWWSTVFARKVAAMVALVLTRHQHKQEREHI